MSKRSRQLVPLKPPPSGDLGPAWNALTSDAHRTFVWCRVVLLMSQGTAARMAGSTATDGVNLRNVGSALDQRPDIKAAKEELVRGIGAAELPRVLGGLRQLAYGSKDEKVRLAALRDLADRFGLAAVAQHHHTVEHTLTDAQKDRRILDLCRELGIAEAEARKMLIDPANVVDAEFSEIVPDPVSPEDEARNARRRELAAMTPEQRAASKADVRARRTTEQKAAYAEAQRAGQTDLEDFLEDDLADLLAPADGGDDA